MKKNYYLIFLSVSFLFLLIGCKAGATYPEKKIGETYKFNGNKITLQKVELLNSLEIGGEEFLPDNNCFYVIAVVKYQYKKDTILDYDLVYLYNYYIVDIPGSTEKTEAIQYIYADKEKTELLSNLDCFSRPIKEAIITFVFQSPPSIRDMRFFQLGEKDIYFLDQYDYGR